MRTQIKRPMFLGLVMFTGFSTLALAVGRTPDVVGKVVNSSNATIEGSELLSNRTIFSGEAVDVGEGGSVLLSYSPTGRAVLAASTHVRLNGSKGNIVAQLLSGTLAVEREKKDAFIVKTPTYRFAPQGEGRTRFLVALLADKRTIIEAQNGEVAITKAGSVGSYTLAEGLRAEISESAAQNPDQPKEVAGKVIGQVVSSAGATRNGKPLPDGEWLLDGDLVSTGASGRAVVKLWPTNQATIEENTSATFTRPVERVWLTLLTGTIVVENTGESNILVATAKYHIEPLNAAAGRILVAARTDRSKEVQSHQSYSLGSGEDKLIPATASGLPPQTPNPTPNHPTPNLTPTPSAPSEPEPFPEEPSASAGRTHSTLLIVAIAGGAGIAAAAVALAAGGGHSGPPVSPSAP
jgi:hypothetical protein